MPTRNPPIAQISQIGNHTPSNSYILHWRLGQPFTNWPSCLLKTNGDLAQTSDRPPGERSIYQLISVVRV